MDKQTWLSDAYAAFARFVACTGTPFTIEQARAFVAPRIDEPADLRWWGIVTKAAKRDGLIRAVGFKPAKSSHHALKPTWTRGQA
jgi:hypothetical protein